tara:strand:+ start:191 stop:373 length:183 start_codon:yes stop_codon:yes gene_type:complete
MIIKGIIENIIAINLSINNISIRLSKLKPIKSWERSVNASLIPRDPGVIPIKFDITETEL